MADTPSKAIRFEIKIDGSSELSAADGDPYILRDGGSVQLIHVEKHLDAPGAFAVRMDIMRDQALTVGDLDYEGKPIEIGLNLQEKPKVVFKGEISYVEPNFLAGGADSFLEISGYDHLHRMTRGMNARTWGDGFEEQEAYSDVANDVISNSASQDTSKVSDSLSADKVDTTDAKLTYVAQPNVSDYQFMRSLGLDAARPAGTDAAKDDKKVSFRKLDTAGQPILKVCRDKVDSVGSPPGLLGRNCRLRLSTVQQYAKVVVRGWDPTQKKAIVGEATSAEQSFDGTPGFERVGKAFYGSASAGRVYTMTNHPVTSQEEAEAIAQAAFNRFALDFLTGEVETDGFPDAEPGALIELSGFGTRFDGKYLVMGVIHEVRASEGFHTIFQVARNAAPDPS